MSLGLIVGLAIGCVAVYWLIDWSDQLHKIQEEDKEE
jgi:uncharacterized membrane-anchored protein YhcB (DUF1043 family)